jgi:hypothetical protein
MSGREVSPGAETQARLKRRVGGLRPARGQAPSCGPTLPLLCLPPQIQCARQESHLLLAKRRWQSHDVAELCPADISLRSLDPFTFLYKSLFWLTTRRSLSLS